MTCPACGSIRSAPRLDGKPFCRDDKGCNARRVAKRIVVDAKRGGPQCMAAIGSRSIRFCLMRQGHDGQHAHGSTEWGEGERSPVGDAFGALLGALGGAK